MLRIASRSALPALAAVGLLLATPLAADARDNHRGRHEYQSHRQHEGRGHRESRHHDARRRDGDRHDRQHQARRHHRNERRSHHAHGPDRGHHDSARFYAPYRGYSDAGRFYAPRYRRPVVVHSSPFYCAPCGHGFSSRRHFHGHLTGHHDIAARLLANVIVQTLQGFRYYGY
jgi:uncharacterized protein involved in copper resistance